MTDERSEMERHIQTVLVALSTAALIWLASSVSQTRESVARLEERVTSLSVRMQVARELQGRVYDLDRRVGILEARGHD